MLLCAAMGHAQSDRESYLDAVRKSGKTGIHLDVIRRAGMTHAAVGDLTSAAELLAGVSILRVSRDARGDLVWMYAPNNWWVMPGGGTHATSPPGRIALSVRSMTERDRFDDPPVQAKIKTLIEYLKKLADADGSGFVSTAEGHVLCRRIELGFLVPQFQRAPTIRELARMLKEEPEQVEGDLTAYLKMREAAIRDGMDGFPALPE
jgi:hypothetical protein